MKRWIIRIKGMVMALLPIQMVIETEKGHKKYVDNTDCWIEDESMPDQLRKSRKRGSYQKIESQTMLAAATNVVRRGYHVEQAATAAQIKPATLRSAVRRYRLRGTVVPKKRSRKANGEFNTDVVRFICDWVDEHEHTVPLYTTLWMQWMLMHFLKN